MATTATQKDEKGKIHLLVEKFQCPGCVLGGDTECGAFKLNDTPGAGDSCVSHVAGTAMLGGGTMYLGLPKGFCKVGMLLDDPASIRAKQKNNIRIYQFGTKPDWNEFNVAVWAMDGFGDEAGFLFVRTFSPRINVSYVDIIEGGDRATLCPNAIDVGTFIDEID